MHFSSRESGIGETTEVRDYGTIVVWGEFDSFGFVRRDKSPRGKQVFVNVNAAGRRLEPGTRISYRLVEHPRGLRAVDVKIENKQRLGRRL